MDEQTRTQEQDQDQDQEQERSQEFVVPGGDVAKSQPQAPAPANASPVVLIYVGGSSEHGAFIFGVPARDLTQSDIEACGLSADELLRFTPAVYALV